MNIALITFSLNFFCADFSICTAKGNQIYPRLLSKNNQYYIFWADYRHGGDYALYGTRLTKAGKVLDSNGKLLFKHKAAYQPAIAADETNILAVFRDGC